MVKRCEGITIGGNKFLAHDDTKSDRVVALRNERIIQSTYLTRKCQSPAQTKYSSLNNRRQRISMMISRQLMSIINLGLMAKIRSHKLVKTPEGVFYAINAHAPVSHALLKPLGKTSKVGNI
ncbi:unnamed protein product [Protopolystoma xenopodis]|uniref:Uncharacterized protein n=1 Tax=Protopolystoma xenopodis TaxID=117903 RepID=A0A448XS14_9PLAT|nr:unnamed protein product [Protopolystoma xenopodis]